MSRRTPSRIGLVVCIVAIGASLATAGQPGDAGAGRDASGDAISATLLPNLGTYAGWLDAGDTDWYAVDHSRPAACVQLTTLASVAHDVTLALQGGSPHSVTGTASPSVPATLTLAGPAVTRAQAGLRSVTSTAGDYEFSLRAFTAAELGTVDTGTSGDAPAVARNATLVQPGCLRGTVGLKDTTDVFGFSVTGPDQVIYTLGATGAASPGVSILDAGGAILGRVITSGELGIATVPAAGTYYLSVTMPLDASSSEYVVGLLSPDRPGHPCRPYCRAS